jgi:UDP-3-O-[3-hydroxymyristoyl] N-acetylglucosamine deacetylase/3-hydroxyacyl-[acyl-carrier-protein] dehydratase
LSDRQHTISREVSLAGRGLFTGEQATLTFSPANPNSGISFLREQGEYVASIPAVVQNVLKRPRHTCLRNGTLHVETVEHCMAALRGLGIDNAVVKVSGGVTGEIPSLDGSCRPFVEAIADAGVTEQDAALNPIVIRKPVQVTLGNATLAALPGPTDRLEIIYTFEAPAPVGRQVFSFHLGADDFASQIAPARTFVFEHEVQELRARGYGLHLTGKDLLVISPDGPIDNEYRFADECVRHKVLDLIGDLYLAGGPIFGRIVAHRSGHELNHMLVRRLLKDRDLGDRETLLQRDAALDIRRIQRILPHRYPMLLIDRVLSCEPGKEIVALKNVTINEPFFSGHFPHHPVMPGVLIVEALAQAAAILAFKTFNLKSDSDSVYYFVGIDDARFKKPVMPGDQLILKAQILRTLRGIWKFSAQAIVGDTLVSEAQLLCTMRNLPGNAGK